MLTGAIVLYNNNENILSDAINSFLNTPLKKRLYLIDNSETDVLRKFDFSPEVTYIHTGQNLGFGKGHNLIMDELKGSSTYHLILNPDAYFADDVIPLLLDWLKRDESIGIVAPKILYPNGEFQKSVRRFPRLQDLLIRRIPLLKSIFKRRFERANYLDRSLDRPIEVEALSGCFQMFRTKVFVEIKGFDPRYFMYMEDLDICRTVHKHGYKVVYFPLAKVYHRSAYGSKRKLKLLSEHIVSMTKYFMKWNS